MRIYLAIAVFFLLAIPGLHAQLNESDTTRFQFRAALGGNYQRGNVEYLGLRGQLQLTVAPHRNLVFKSQNSSLYQVFFSQKADNDIFSRNFVYFKPQGRVYPFAIAWASTNFRRQLKHRTFAGAGASLQVVRKPGHSLKFSGSLVYETSQFRTDTFNFPRYDGSPNINLWRGTLYLAGQHYLFQRKMRIFYDAWWQPAFSDARNYRTQLDVGVDIPFWKGLNFNILYSYTHENVVALPVRQNDELLSFGISYSLKRNWK